MQRFVPRALLKKAVPIDILSVLLSRNGYGRNGYGPKCFWAENEQSPADGVCVGIRVPRTQNRRSKNEDAIFVCLNFYATVRCKKVLAERQLQGIPQSAAERFLETYHCIAKRCKTFRSASAMQRISYFSHLFDASQFAILVIFAVACKLTVIGIIHVSSCINICHGSKKLFEPEAAKLLSRDMANVNALK